MKADAFIFDALLLLVFVVFVRRTTNFYLFSSSFLRKLKRLTDHGCNVNASEVEGKVPFPFCQVSKSILSIALRRARSCAVNTRTRIDDDDDKYAWPEKKIFFFRKHLYI